MPTLATEGLFKIAQALKYFPCPASDSITAAKSLYHSLTGPGLSALHYNESAVIEGEMLNLSSVIQQLREEQARAQSGLQRLDQAISAIESLGTTTSTHLKRGRGRRTLSADARRRIAEAQKRRWARVKRQKGEPTRNRVLSPAARRKIAAAQRARWARVRAQKK
jgi:hypothetical protein